MFDFSPPPPPLTVNKYHTLTNPLLLINSILTFPDIIYEINLMKNKDCLSEYCRGTCCLHMLYMSARPP